MTPMTTTQERLLETLCESDDFKAVLDDIRQPEAERERRQIALHLKDGNLSKACISQGALEVWESELARAFLRRLNKIQEQQKGTTRPPRG